METPKHIPMMIKKLYELVATGDIDGRWPEDFICDMLDRLQRAQGFTPKQIEKIEELFEEN